MHCTHRLLRRRRPVLVQPHPHAKNGVVRGDDVHFGGVPQLKRRSAGLRYFGQQEERSYFSSWYVGKPLRPAKLERLRKSQVLMTRIFARHKAGRERHLARLPSALLQCQSGLHAGLASGPKGQEITLHQAQTIPREQGCGRRGVRHMTRCPTVMRACRMPSPTLTHALRLNSRCS